MMNRTQAIVYALGIVALLGVGGGITAALLLARDTPAQNPREEIGPLVNVTRAQRTSVEVVIAGHGTVRVKTEAQVVPQVGGRVMHVHPNLISGGYIRANEPILRIDESDYKLALDQAAANMASASADVASATATLTEAKAKLADAMDDLDRSSKLVASGSVNPREQRKAQVAVEVGTAQRELAEAQLAAAQSRLALAKVQSEQASLHLARTVVTLPFNAVVREESVDAGQFVTAGQSLATVYGTDAVEIPVPLEDEELKWFERVPMAHQITEQSIPRDELPIADIKARFGGRECHWIGRVVRIEGTIDPRTRMVHVIVEVEDPLPVLRDAAANTEAGRPPLIPGAFVNVEIRGKKLDDVYELPRHSIHPGDDGGEEVWIAADGKLEVRPVNVVRRGVESVYVSQGVSEGELVITTPLDIVNHGMKVRVPGGFEDSAAAAATAEAEPPAPPAAGGDADGGVTIEVGEDTPAPVIGGASTRPATP